MKFKFFKAALAGGAFYVGCLFNVANAGLVTVNGTQYDILTFNGTAAAATTEIDFDLNPWFGFGNRGALDFAEPSFGTDPTVRFGQSNVTPFYAHQNRTDSFGPGYGVVTSYDTYNRFSPSNRSAGGGTVYLDDQNTYNWAYVSESIRTNESTIIISDFAANGLSAWVTEGNGTVEVKPSPDGSNESVMQMTIDVEEVNDPISSEILIDIPNDPFFINFDYLFQTPTGSLEVWLNDTLLDELFAADVIFDINATDLLSASILVDDQDLLDLDEGLLRFSLYPGSPAGIVIGGVTLRTSEVPEPSTLAIFTLGLMGLASRRFKRHS